MFQWQGDVAEGSPEEEAAPNMPSGFLFGNNLLPSQIPAESETPVTRRFMEYPSQQEETHQYTDTTGLWSQMSPALEPNRGPATASASLGAGSNRYQNSRVGSVSDPAWSPPATMGSAQPGVHETDYQNSGLGFASDPGQPPPRKRRAGWDDRENPYEDAKRLKQAEAQEIYNAAVASLEQLAAGDLGPQGIAAGDIYSSNAAATNFEPPAAGDFGQQAGMAGDLGFPGSALRRSKKMTPCKFFLQAKCAKTNCLFSHDLDLCAAAIASGQADLEDIGRKPVPCRFFILGRCKNVTDCIFSHDAQLIAASQGTGEVPQLTEKQAAAYKMSLCRYFMTGLGCARGRMCIYAHGPEELRDEQLKMELLQQQAFAQLSAQQPPPLV